MGTARLEEMTWVEVDRLDKDSTILFIPVSPIEEHGPHLPLGTDLFGARDMAEKAAVAATAANPQLGVILVPPIPLGCTPVTSDFPGSLSLRGTTLKAVIRDVCTSLAGHGFRYMLIVNHHLDPMHMKAILEAIEEVCAAYPVRIAELWSRVIYAGMETEESRRCISMGLDMAQEVHAEARETSYILYQYRHLLKSDPAQLPAVHIDVRKGVAEGSKTFRQMGARMGYIGSPAAAEKDLGRLHLEEGAQLAAELAARLIGGDPLPEISAKMKRFLEDHVQLD